MALLGYTRVSSAGQDARLQVDALTDAGVDGGRIYADVTSGAQSTARRSGMAELESYAREGDTVVVWRIDRLGRSLLDVLQTVERLSERGVGVRSLQDGIDPSTPAGRLMLGMLATLAEYERDLIRERVRAGVMAARERGTTFGRPPLDRAQTLDKARVARTEMANGKTSTQAARVVGWSKSTLYRHLKTLDEHEHEVVREAD